MATATTTAKRRTKVDFYTDKISSLKPGTSKTVLKVGDIYPGKHPFRGETVKKWDIEIERSSVYFAAKQIGVSVRTSILPSGAFKISRV